MYDYIIVGAGFAGAVIAQQIAKIKNKRVLVIEKRNHIAGNCYDYYDQHGILVHKYGPHLFHTGEASTFNYLSQFTQWINYQHQVLADIDGQKVPVPFNLNTIDLLFPAAMAQSLTQKLIDRYGYDVKVPILELRKEADQEIKYLADFIYEKMFVNYTAKQWGCSPEEISAEVTARVPVFISRDNRYFQDKYQAIPKQGYTHLFENLLADKNISLLLNTDYQQIVDFNQTSGQVKLFNQNFSGKLIFTGLIDELFNFKFGDLPYRSIQFEREFYSQDFYQDATTVNYPNNYDFTRITEFKRISHQEIKGTSIVKEYPQDYDRNDETKNVPYYPVFNQLNEKKFKQYCSWSAQFKQLILVGRLAQYRYFDMDDIVKEALATFENQIA